MHARAFAGLVALLGSFASAFLPQLPEGSAQHNLLKVYLLPDERPPNRRVVTPNDISSLFGASFAGKSIEKKVPVFDNNDDDDGYEEEEEAVERRGSSVSLGGAASTESALVESVSPVALNFTAAVAAAPREAKKLTPPSPGFEFLDLDQSLEAGVSSQVKESMSVLESGRSSSEQALASPRVFQYDPTESNAMYDPMKYGAYNRWKKVEEATAKANLKKASKKKKTKEGLSTDSFYNAIKNLGSGPKAKDTATGVGVADPPPGKNPITPSKGLSKKNKKKVITPEEIDNLFKKASNADDDSAAPVDPMDAPVPQWIVDADKVARQKRAMKGRKQRRLTDDWRFWAGIITVAGFAAALYTVLQQGGGALPPASSANELII